MASSALPVQLEDVTEAELNSYLLSLTLGLVEGAQDQLPTTVQDSPPVSLVFQAKKL